MDYIRAASAGNETLMEEISRSILKLTVPDILQGLSGFAGKIRESGIADTEPVVVAGLSSVGRYSLSIEPELPEAVTSVGRAILIEDMPPSPASLRQRYAGKGDDFWLLLIDELLAAAGRIQRRLGLT